MVRYCLTIFVSAFLLFQIQPILARLLLPGFGGSSAVWTTCMMFFQVTLCLGYAYAHMLRTWLTPKRAFQVHSILMVTAVGLFLWFRPSADSSVLAGLDSTQLTWSIVLVLSQWIGLPFLLLSTTGPLVQTWQSSTHPEHSPFRLYALSNLGSMLALLSYPFLIEPFLQLDAQLKLWAIGFGVLVSLTFWSLIQTRELPDWHDSSSSTENENEASSGAGHQLADLFRWLLFSATSSVMFLATTNLLCQEVASVPFLWIVPLTIYLGTFIVCFDRPAWYSRRLWICLASVGSIVSILLLHLDVHAGFLLQLIGLCATCLAVCMICHGELEHCKPQRSRLTMFYLTISIGSAMGGIFVTLIASQVFDGFYELHVGLLIALVAGGLYLLTQGKQAAEEPLPEQATLLSKGMLSSMANLLTGTLVFIGLGVVGSSLYYFLDTSNHPGLKFRGRNEYGLTKVEEKEDVRNFVNGRVIHGVQWLDQEKRLQPSAYYVDGSGIAAAFQSIRDIRDQPLKVGVLGLGAGAMSAWLQPKDHIRFYEINPMVVDVAKEYFDFLKMAPGTKEVVIGDGRRLLRQEFQQDGSKHFDLLIMDAFSSDSVPVHLLTEECFQLYDQHLAKDGVLVVHISNRFVDLLPVVLHHRKALGMNSIYIDFRSEDGQQESRWVLLTRNEAILNHPLILQASKPLPANIEPVRWTDDFSSVARQLRWSASIDLDQEPKVPSASQ